MRAASLSIFRIALDVEEHGGARLMSAGPRAAHYRTQWRDGLSDYDNEMLACNSSQGASTLRPSRTSSAASSA
jgi:hypothetical protein